MRFYDIQIGGPTPARYTSHPDGINDPGALNIEFDLPLASAATPMSDAGAYVRVWGIPLRQISQARDFNGAPIKVYGGMRAGFPLSNPAQSGLLVEGTIWQAFGNWVGVNQSLDLIIIAKGGGEPNTPRNIVWNWAAGTPMAVAIANTLSVMAPDMQQHIAISDQLVLAENDTGQYDSLQALAQHIKETSKAIIGGTTYAGVDIRQNGKTFEVYDGTVASLVKDIAFNDLIGQPTWIEPLKIQINTVLRADILVGDRIRLPLTPVIESQSIIDRNQSAFKGEYFVELIRHVGNYKAPDGNSWITTMNAFPVEPIT